MLSDRIYTNCINKALRALPCRVRAAIETSVPIYTLDLIENQLEQLSDDGHNHTGGMFTNIDGEMTIWLSSHMKTRKSIIKTTLHEIAHAWLDIRGLKNTEKQADILERAWYARLRPATGVTT